MKYSQKAGGVAALIEAATFVVGIALGFTMLAPYVAGELDLGETLEFLADNQAVMYIWNIVIYLVFGTFLVVLVLALFDRLRARAYAVALTAAAFGLIWATLMFASGMVFNIGTSTVIDLYGSEPTQAEPVWLAISSVLDGLGGGNEIVGALWILLVSLAALKAAGLPRFLNYLGIVIGIAGLITIVPGLEDVGLIFGLGSIVWFIWLGIAMLRSSPQQVQ